MKPNTTSTITSKHQRFNLPTTRWVRHILRPAGILLTALAVCACQNPLGAADSPPKDAKEAAARDTAVGNDPLKRDLARLQGTVWTAKVTMEESPTRWKLAIKDTTFTITIASEDGDTVYFKGEGEFKLEKHGRFKAFTWWNLKTIEGDARGDTRLTGGKTQSSIYRFDGSTFTTVGGVREDDEDKPLLIRWEKV